ncbi:hypothetical protein ACFVFS_23950 [Kitasatospora sp. NPDC057692]|uniref:hypothetical protein n=1 Tax=Kitasatospora sp. NPDC057692 TaxID=3346215 RepID=UPI0036A17A2A
MTTTRAVTMHIDSVTPDQVAAKDDVVFHGSGLGLVTKAYFTDANKKVATSPAQGREQGKEAVAKCPEGLAIGHAQVALGDDKNPGSNSVDIDIVSQ